MGGLLSRFSRQDDFVNRTFLIHGHPYQFDERLGSGSFGAVYAARSPMGQDVAVKVININGVPSHAQRIVETYLNEVALLNRLRQESRHVVVIFDFDFDPQTGLAFIVMELGGENLGKLITRLRGGSTLAGSSLNPKMIRGIWRQMVTIIATLHANGIVHMDFKPDNLIFFGPILKIADLGISRKVDMVGIGGVGTPFFSAPEIMQDMAGLRRFYSPKADVWSLGAILYFMIYGRPPAYHSRAANPPPGQAPYPDPLLNDVLRRTLVVDPYARANINTLLAHPFTNS